MGRKKFDGAWECINGGLHLQCCGNLSPESHYPSMTTYPKGTSSSMEEGSELAVTVVFCVMGMTCAACAGSVEKAIKRLPGIREAVVDVLNDKAQVLYLPTIVNVSICSIPTFYLYTFVFKEFYLYTCCYLIYMFFYI